MAEPARAAPFVLIAAFSGRAIAASARRAGYQPLVADLFDDDDTRALAAASERVAGSVARGLSALGLLAALDRLAADRTVAGLVLGSGFEDRPALMARLAARHRLLGNTPDTVAAAKDPFRLASVCTEHGIPHPEISREPRADGGDWLAKRAGASGGTHIRARTFRHRRGRYWQRRVPGVPVAAAFVADGRRARVLATTQQWCAPAPGQPFRYGGAVRPAGLSAAQTDAISASVGVLTSAFGLRGLNGADFLASPHEAPLLLEINPRPGATLDVIDDADGSAFELHVAAYEGNLPASIPPLPHAHAAVVLYATDATFVPAGFAWPAWAGDRQPANTTVPAGAPLCTVLARAKDAAGAERLAAERTASLLARLSVERKRAA